jgi:hypothetical protein
MELALLTSSSEQPVAGIRDPEWLRALVDRNFFQDHIDRLEARNKLRLTLQWFWLSMDEFGNYDGGNFWIATSECDVLAGYSCMVLLLCELALRPSKGD